MMPHHDPAEFPHFDPTETREQMRERLQHGTGTTTTRLSRAQVERLLRMASGARTPEEIGVDFDLTEIRALARDCEAYMTALEKLRNIDPNNWSVIEDLIEWVAGVVNEVLP